LDYRPESYTEAYNKGVNTQFNEKSIGNYYRKITAVLSDDSDLIRFTNVSILPPHQEYALKWLKDNVPQGAYVFDCGCSTGRFLIVLQKEGFQSLGMDIAEEPIKLLKEKGFQVVLGSIEDYPSDWPEPAAVTLFEVLEHLPDPVNFLKSILRRLPNSKLLLSVPSPRRYGVDTVNYPPHHFTWWTEHALSLALERAGYDGTVVFPKVSSNEFTGTGIGRLIARFRRSGGTEKKLIKENFVSTALERRFSLIKKWLYAPFVAYLNFKGYSSHSMVGIALPKIKKDK
jgi:2-polyprenyl-3-methyl-5-hydroxy-6-metoxy-1,4-benzoquinol methylase